jgi:hypothetical protein
MALTKAKLKARESGQTLRGNPVNLFYLLSGGIYTGRRIAMPTSIHLSAGMEIDFFGYKLRVVRTAYGTRSGSLETTGRLLPESWFVDLNTPCDLEEVAA